MESGTDVMLGHHSKRRLDGKSRLRDVDCQPKNLTETDYGKLNRTNTLISRDGNCDGSTNVKLYLPFSSC